MNSDGIVRLKTELAADPLGRGYAEMADAEVVRDLLTTYRTRGRTSISAAEILNATDRAELLALDDVAKQVYGWILNLGQVDLSMTGINQNYLGGLFPAGSYTRAALIALVASTDAISRAEELGIRGVTEGDVILARRI